MESLSNNLYKGCRGVYVNIRKTIYRTIFYGLCSDFLRAIERIFIRCTMCGKSRDSGEISGAVADEKCVDAKIGFAHKQA